MKRILLSSLALASLALAAPAQASNSTWNTSDQCKTILSLPEVSDYTRAVLARADAGIEEIRLSAVDPGFDVPWYADILGSAWVALIGTQSTQQTTDLFENTACLRFDMAAIECKMDQVRHEMRAQLKRGSFVAILQLEKLLSFLNNRTVQIMNGAFDPLYSDPTWQEVQSFDPENDPSGYSLNAMMCPYTSDYGPPLQNGFGCDLDVLRKRTSFEPLKQEYDALEYITNTLRNYQANAGQPAQTVTHLTANGCGWTGGLCSSDPSVRCTSDSECSNAGTCVLPRKVCDKNHTIRCNSDFSCLSADGTDNGPCIADDGSAPAATALRGPFSVTKKQLELLFVFLRKRVAQGNAREYPNNLKNISEFRPDDVQSQEDRTDEPGSFSLARQSYRAMNQAWSRYQGAQEAAAFPTSSDPLLEITDALRPLREAISGLARLTKIDPNQDKKDDLRSFTIRFASYLLRTCTERACTASLEEVLKIAFKDECFPYTNGEYLDDTPGNPRSKKCADAAGITVP